MWLENHHPMWSINQFHVRLSTNWVSFSHFLTYLSVRVFIFHTNLSNSMENGVSVAEHRWTVNNNNRMAHVLPLYSHVRYQIFATMPLLFGVIVVAAAAVFHCFRIHYSKVNWNTIGNLCFGFCRHVHWIAWWLTHNGSVPKCVRPINIK